jgi:hypothetical protein
MNNNGNCILMPFGFNMFFGISNRILQIIDYLLNRH